MDSGKGKSKVKQKRAMPPEPQQPPTAELQDFDAAESVTPPGEGRGGLPGTGLAAVPADVEQFAIELPPEGGAGSRIVGRLKRQRAGSPTVARALPAAAGLLRPSAAFYTRARPLRRGRHVCAKGTVRAGCIRASLSREPELRRRSSDNARTRADEMDGHSLPPFTDVARLLAGCLLVFAGRAGRTARRLLSGTRLTGGAVGAFLLPGRKPSRSARCA